MAPLAQSEYALEPFNIEIETVIQPHPIMSYSCEFMEKFLSPRLNPSQQVPLDG
jgi:hypothetical protein